jgi:predicted 3-demethylubiquinone-9 3-methyltransferase (glyoxalase superfamily)
MPAIHPFLWYNGQAEEAANLYVSIFKNAKIISVQRQGANGPVAGVTFEIEGQRLVAFNGGPMYTFTPAISLYVDCKTQAEVDELWDKLLAGGGTPNRCGWLADKFGVSWQIIPSILTDLLNNANPVIAQKAVQAMLQMAKIDIAALQRATAA